MKERPLGLGNQFSEVSMTQDKTAQFVMNSLMVAACIVASAAFLAGCAIAAYFLQWYGQW